MFQNNAFPHIMVSRREILPVEYAVEHSCMDSTFLHVFLLRNIVVANLQASGAEEEKKNNTYRKCLLSAKAKKALMMQRCCVSFRLRFKRDITFSQRYVCVGHCIFDKKKFNIKMIFTRFFVFEFLS